MDGHLDLTGAAAADRDLLAEAAVTLRTGADLLDGGEELPSLERIWQARIASAAHLRGLTGDPDDGPRRWLITPFTRRRSALPRPPRRRTR